MQTVEGNRQLSHVKARSCLDCQQVAARQRHGPACLFPEVTDTAEVKQYRRTGNPSDRVIRLAVSGIDGCAVLANAGIGLTTYDRLHHIEIAGAGKSRGPPVRRRRPGQEMWVPNVRAQDPARRRAGILKRVVRFAVFVVILVPPARRSCRRDRCPSLVATESVFTPTSRTSSRTIPIWTTLENFVENYPEVVLEKVLDIVPLGAERRRYRAAVSRTVQRLVRACLYFTPGRSEK